MNRDRQICENKKGNYEVCCHGCNDVYNFAVKWNEKFRDQNIRWIELSDHSLGDDCKALGFKMDCGHAFRDKFGRAEYDARTLEAIIENVNDISLLGSAIYSRWRYFTHWSFDSSEIASIPNRSWFIIAFNRLADLSKDEQEK